MERILAILARPQGTGAVLTALGKLLSRLPGSQLSLLHPRPCVDPSFMPTEEVWTDDRRHAFDEERDRIFLALQRDVAVWSSPSRPRGLTLRQIVGKPAKVIIEEAAHADLIVLSNVDQKHAPEAETVFETALFQTALPLLLIPNAIMTTFAQHAVIAWERSQAADEAVDAALPLLLSADEVTVLTVEEGHNTSLPPAGLLQALEQRGKAARIRQFELGNRNIGDALLAEAYKAGADLLVMGAFTHRRILEAVFGGATRQVLANTTIPLLIHH